MPLRSEYNIGRVFKGNIAKSANTPAIDNPDTCGLIRSVINLVPTGIAAIEPKRLPRS
jgi:hypothetical protein